jgi:hypothetical protein
MATEGLEAPSQAVRDLLTGLERRLPEDEASGRAVGDRLTRVERRLPGDEPPGRAVGDRRTGLERLVPEDEAPGRAVGDRRSGLDRWLPADEAPWWRRAIGLPFYVLAAALVIGGLVAGIAGAVLQGLEVGVIGLLAADVRGLRRHTPLLRAESKRRAAIGWALVLASALALAVLIPVQ